jgi:hypothetical protein
MSHVRAIPGWTQARDAVRNNPQLNWRVANLPDHSVGFLNEVKKHFDQAAENAASKFNPGRNHQVQATHEMQASAVKQIGEAKSADYQIALEISDRDASNSLSPCFRDRSANSPRRTSRRKRRSRRCFPKIRSRERPAKSRMPFLLSCKAPPCGR